MAYISVTNNFSNGEKTSSSQMNTNFKDITDGLSDGTKDLNVQNLTATKVSGASGTLNNLSVNTLTISNPNTIRKQLSITSKPYYPMMKPTYLNLASTDADLIGFMGGFSDGNYGYAIPYSHKKVARFLLSDFTTVSVLDLGGISASYTGFMGGFTDGRYGYCIPYNNGSEFGTLVRFYLTDFASVVVLDLSSYDSDLVGFTSGFYDGRYCYLSTYTNTKIARIDLNDFVTITVLDTGIGGLYLLFTDGIYGYYSSIDTSNIYRFNISNFSTIEELTIGYDCLKGFTDGRYGYGVSSGFPSRLIRFETNTFTSYTQCVLPQTGMSDAFTDGRYAYIMPDQSGFDGTCVRVDLYDMSTIATCDWTKVYSGLMGYKSCFRNRNYGYAIPYYNMAIHGIVTRIQLDSGT
jgi:hypothetical protein